MRLRSLPVIAALLTLTAAPGFASMTSGGGKPETPMPSSSNPGDAAAGDAVVDRRKMAEKWYADAYEDVAKAKDEVAAGKAKNAEKRFRRALERGEKATEWDSLYHEAWNLIGFSARKLGDYPKSLASYEHCLRIKPDFAPAREYLGEALVETGKPKEAREQLAWLEKLEAADLAKELRTKIEAYEAAHPDAGATTGATIPGK